MQVKTMYDKVAINTGFPLFQSDNATPETTRFILEMLNQALQNVIDNIYISNNVLERRDRILLQPGITRYAVEGMVKSIQFTEKNDYRLVGRFIKYDRILDQPGQILPQEKIGVPLTYTIDRGDIRFLPNPDKNYEVEVTVSTTNLVWANDDTSKGEITDVLDAIMASKAFCDLVTLRACAFIMARCQNALADFYNNLYTQRLSNFIERDSHSFEQPKLYNPRKGHYNPRRGLLG